jgi:minor extracellular serine protease Vpr
MDHVSPALRAALRARLPSKSIAVAVAGGALLSILVSAAFAAGTDLAGPGVAAKSALVANSATGRFKQYLGTPVSKPARMPLGASRDQRVTVVVRMSTPPVAAVRALRPDHTITAAEHGAIHQQIDQDHASVEPTIVARGGEVMAHFHDAVNGIKVQIDRNELPGLAALPGVVEVMPVGRYHLDNAQSVPFIGAPTVWQGTPGFRGEGVKIAVIDTGIDYTHANFGGPGTAAAFTAAAASSTKPADPTLFGPKAPKVKGGIDLVGDAYTGFNAPQPDPNPLDCEGHGSHTSGTAAGFGIGADGKTYHGPYDSDAYAQVFKVGPGVAPKADLYAVRVFGCTGSTNLVVDAIDWAVDNDMDVISMSLGSDFGTADAADALAVTNAAHAGILVASASGNAGAAPYITSTPASGDGGISVAAMDSHASFPGAQINLPGASIEALDANGAPLTGPLKIVVLRTPTGGVSLGCSETEYVDSVIAGKLVVTLRGTCARVQRAQFGQKHGAAAVAMINSSAGYPPYEGPIPGVSIPFLGVLPTDAPTLTAAAAASSFVANTIQNPTYRKAAGFSSSGPRFGDSALRPNVAAPGVSVFSTAVGTGTGGFYASGTSMATPHVAGVAALVRQAHPKWDETAQRAAVVDTAEPAQLLDYAPRIEGAGLVQPVGATKTQAVVLGDDSPRSGGEEQEDTPHGLSFGFEEFTRDFHATRAVTVRNYGNSRIVFRATTTAVGGSPHTAHLSDSTLSIGPRDEANLELTLKVPAATVGSTHDALGNDAFQEVAGYVTLVPVDSAMNNGVTLHVPYYLVPRARSKVSVGDEEEGLSPGEPNQVLRLKNHGGALTGNADFYAWGLIGKPQGIKYFDTKAVGVQSNLISATDSVLVFAINTFKRVSNTDAGEFDIFIDVNGDGVPDYDLAAVDQGAFEAGTASGVQITVLVNLTTGAAIEEFLVDSPTDGSTLLLPVLASDMGVSPVSRTVPPFSTGPRFSYSETTYNLFDGTQASLPGRASFNAFSPAITNALFVPVAPNATALVPVAIDPKEWKVTPARGLMIVVEDNFSGAQSELIPAR